MTGWPILRWSTPSPTSLTPGDFAAGGERQRRLELVLVLDNQHVRKVDAGSLDVDHHLALAGDRRIDFLQNQRFGGAERLAHDGFHDCFPLSRNTDREALLLIRFFKQAYFGAWSEPWAAFFLATKP